MPSTASARCGQSCLRCQEKWHPNIAISQSSVSAYHPSYDYPVPTDLLIPSAHLSFCHRSLRLTPLGIRPVTLMDLPLALYDLPTPISFFFSFNQDVINSLLFSDPLSSFTDPHYYSVVYLFIVDCGVLNFFVRKCLSAHQCKNYTGLLYFKLAAHSVHSYSSHMKKSKRMPQHMKVTMTNMNTLILFAVNLSH